jgi:hypothetical protein
VLNLLQHETGMMDECPAGACEHDTAPSALQQRHTRKLLHFANALARGGKGHVRPFGSTRDTRGLGDVEEKLHVNQIEAHLAPSQPSTVPKASSGNATLSAARDLIKLPECMRCHRQFSS